MALPSKLARAIGGVPVARARTSRFAMVRMPAANFHQKNTRRPSPRRSTFVVVNMQKLALSATEPTSRFERFPVRRSNHIERFDLGTTCPTSACCAAPSAQWLPVQWEPTPKTGAAFGFSRRPAIQSLAAGARNDPSWLMGHEISSGRSCLLRNEGMPNGVAMIAKNQMTGPPTLPALSSITPEVTMAKRNVRSAMPITKTPMK